MQDPGRAVPYVLVLGLAFASLDLQSCLDDIAGRGEICGRHTSNGACREKLQDSKFLRLAFAKEVSFEVIVRGEVDAGEGNVPKQTSTGTAVQTHETKILHNPHGGAAGHTFDIFGNFTLYLQTDLDDF